MKIIFLDIDGVLNSEASALLSQFRFEQGLMEYKDAVWQFCPQATNNFRKLLKSLPDVKIVLSSSWRHGRTDAGCSELLSENGLDGARCIGRTGATRNGWHRGQEIQDWLTAHTEVTDFIILDDDSDMDHLMDNLIQTNGRIGLTLDDVDRAIRLLK